MDYEKKYKEALERARQIKNGEGNWRYSDLIEITPALEEVFPELTESEDERIREELIGALMWQRDNIGVKGPRDNNLILPGFTMKVGDVLAYLEKQKEQKPRWEINNPPTTEWTKEMIDEKFEELVEEYHKQKLVEWSEEDLEHIKSIIHRTEVYGGNCLYGRAKEDLEWLKNLLNRFPTQPKQEWSEEDEQNYQSIRAILLEDTAKKIGKRTYGDVLEWYESKGSGRFNLPKIKWSEEDEKRVKQLIYDTEFIKAHYEKRKEKLGEQFNNALIRDCDEQIAWLKSLPLNLKKKNEDVAKLCSNEWSEEDALTIADLINYFEGDSLECSAKEMVQRIKSLRPSWKPSEEQMKGLLVAIGDEKERGSDVVKPLRSLYKQLKKL